MAAAGFYYPGYSYDVCDCKASFRTDTVRCAFCGIMLRDWKAGDNPVAEHKKWSPSCKFVIEKTMCC